MSKRGNSEERRNPNDQNAQMRNNNEKMKNESNMFSLDNIRLHKKKGQKRNSSSPRANTLMEDNTQLMSIAN